MYYSFKAYFLIPKTASDALNYNSNLNSNWYVNYFWNFWSLLKTTTTITTGNQVSEKLQDPNTNSTWKTPKELAHVRSYANHMRPPLIFSVTPWKAMQVEQREISHSFLDFWWRFCTSFKLFFCFCFCVFLSGCHLHIHFGNSFSRESGKRRWMYILDQTGFSCLED